MPLATERRPVGRAGLTVSRLGVGGGSLINETGAAGVRAILDAAWDAGLRHYDTAALYAGGESERRFGAALRGRPRDDFVLSTKIGRFPGDVFDYTADRTRRAVEEGLDRLSLDRADIVSIHDVTRALHGEAFEARFAEAMDGAGPALFRMREEGRIGAVGIAQREPDNALRLLRAGPFDCVMLANGWTLLQHDALDALLPHCATNGVAVMVAAPFNTGILATGAVPGARYDRAPATPAILDRVARLEAICARHGVPLPAAALQFPLRHPAVANVVAGHQSVAELHGNLRLMDHPIPEALWAEMEAEGLIPRL